MSFVSVFDVMMGDFDVFTFKHGRYWLLPVSFFILFMLGVPTVMLNALIAIMVSCFAFAPLGIMRVDSYISLSLLISLYLYYNSLGYIILYIHVDAV